MPLELLTLDKERVFLAEEEKISEERAVKEIQKTGAFTGPEDDILDALVSGHFVLQVIPVLF